MKFKVQIKKTVEVEGDFYVSYFKEGRAKGDRNAIYFGTDLKAIKKVETKNHGEPVIIEKMDESELGIKFERLTNFLHRAVSKSGSNELPICIAVYE